MVANQSRHPAVLVGFLIALSVSALSCRTQTGETKQAATTEQATATPPVLRPEPRVIVKVPVSGSGKELSTSVIFHDDAGQLNVTDMYLLINDPTRGVDGTGGCVLWDRRTTGDLFLLDDMGKKWLGPHKVGSDAVIANSQCLVSLKNTGLAEVNGDLQWVTSLAFSKRFSGPKQIYAKAVNKQQRESNFTLLGSWTAN